MGMIRRSGPASRGWGPGHARQLFSGTDDFGDGWGNPPSVPPGEVGPDWPDAETLADMAAAWEALEAGRLVALKDYPFHSPRSWGYRVFVLGEDPQQALANIEKGEVMAHRFEDVLNDIFSGGDDDDSEGETIAALRDENRRLYAIIERQSAMLDKLEEAIQQAARPKAG